MTQPFIRRHVRLIAANNPGIFKDMAFPLFFKDMAFPLFSAIQK
jgi:hypothetical protein